MTKYNSLGASTTQINVLAVLEATSPRPGCQHGWALARLSFWLVNDALLTVHTCGRWTKKSITLGPSPFNFNYHLKALSPSTVTMRVRASASEFWGKYNSGHAWPENVTESQSVYTERLEGCSSKSKTKTNRNERVPGHSWCVPLADWIRGQPLPPALQAPPYTPSPISPSTIVNTICTLPCEQSPYRNWNWILNLNLIMAKDWHKWKWSRALEVTFYSLVPKFNSSFILLIGLFYFFPKAYCSKANARKKKNSLTNMKKKDKCLMKMMSIDPDPAEWASESLGANEALITAMQASGGFISYMPVGGH